VPPVEYAGGKCCLRAYIAVCLQIHCNSSSLYMSLCVCGCARLLLQSLRASLLSHCANITRDSPNLIVTPVRFLPSSGPNTDAFERSVLLLIHLVSVTRHFIIFCQFFHQSHRPPLLHSRSYFTCFADHSLNNFDKNSSGDEIANVNFLRRYGTYVLQNTKKENLLRLTN